MVPDWVLLLGPLVGYGFLAGATLDIPNEDSPAGRRWRRLFARRGAWVAVGPWAGFMIWAGVYFGLMFLNNLIPANWHPDWQPPHWWKETWAYWVLSWAVAVLMVGTFAYGWLWPAWFALRRAARIGLWGRALYRGLITAMAFVGSLFGTFWAITSAWRSYFFDPRVMPLIALTLGLAAMSGCAATVTYGEVRRRELFHAMLVAWVLGLALMWRWAVEVVGGPEPPRNAEEVGRASGLIHHKLIGSGVNGADHSADRSTTPVRWSRRATSQHRIAQESPTDQPARTSLG